MMLSIYKSKAGKISTKEVASMTNAKKVRNELNLVGESNPLYFFEFDGVKNHFYQIDADGHQQHLTNNYIMDSIPDDIKTAVIKYENPNIRGAFISFIIIDAIDFIDDEMLIGYNRVSQVAETSKIVFYKKLSGTFESILLEFYGNDISLPEIIKSNWVNAKNVDIVLYSAFEGKLIPVDFTPLKNKYSNISPIFDKFGSLKYNYGI